MNKCTFCGREGKGRTKHVKGYTILEDCTDCERELNLNEETPKAIKSINMELRVAAVMGIQWPSALDEPLPPPPDARSCGAIAYVVGHECNPAYDAEFIKAYCIHEDVFSRRTVLLLDDWISGWKDAKETEETVLKTEAWTKAKT